MADLNKPGLFEKGGKLYWLHSTIDAFDTFLRVPGTVTAKGAHVRDGIDLKRVMIMVVIALVPAALFGMYNVGLQTSTLYGLGWNFWQMFWYGFLRMLPLFVVSYAVGLAIEFGSAQIRGEEVNEGYLVTGFLIPLIVPVDVPLWMLALAVAFSVIFVKEVFGCSGLCRRSDRRGSQDRHAREPAQRPGRSGGLLHQGGHARQSKCHQGPPRRNSQAAIIRCKNTIKRTFHCY